MEISNLISCFNDVVKNNGSITALVYEDTKISYSSLSKNVEKLSSFFEINGILEGTTIGVFLDRSIQSITAFLAIQNCNCIYLPLDRKSPESRIKYIIDESKPKYILTRNKWENDISNCMKNGTEIIDIDTVLNDRFIHDPRMIKNSVSKNYEGLAYIIYTSGSTGTPKGVMIDKKSLSNFITWRLDYFRSKSIDVFLHKAPLSVDMSIAEIIAPLTCGGALVIAKEDEILNSSYLTELIFKHKITNLSSVPTMLDTLLENWSKCASIKNVVCGGETLSKNLVSKFNSITAKDCRLHNIYGPTETTIAVSCYTFDKEHHSDVIPIGKPINNVNFKILSPQDDNNGISGELLISGECVSSGYLNDQALDSISFIFIENEENKKIKYYRTGDWVRKLKNGNYVFINRNDEQIKINGHRIELGEIEAVLNTCPLIENCVVIAKTFNNNKFICAFVSPIQKEGLNKKSLENQLNDFLNKRIQSHMIPSRFEFISKLPTTHNGKIDKKHLSSLIKLTRNSEIITKEINKKISKMWSNILFIDQCFIQDDTKFYDIGGNSLLIGKLVHLLTDEFDVDIKITDLLNNLSIEEMANCISSKL